MDLSEPTGCRHPDIRKFDDLRCCVSCGFTLPLPIATPKTAAPENDTNHNNLSECHYRPLNYELGQEIRLINLRPGNYSEPIVCEIVRANLLDSPKYEALSYTWADENGDDALSSHIICAMCGSLIDITANCDAALRRLRHQTATRTIWVDSISIEQSNIQERNHHVMQMGNIYSSAQQVLVYLGEEDVDSKEIFGYLKKAIIIRRDESFVTAFPGNQEAPHFSTMKRLLSRRWFHRVWVLQEVGLSRKTTVLCGEQSLDWAFFSVDLLRDAGLRRETYGGITPGVLLLESDLYKGSPGMVDLLHAARNAKCKDPRDNVYAILNLVSEEKRLNIQPDYTKSVDWLFTQVAVQSMLHDRSLNILSHVRGKKSIGVPATELLVQEKTSLDDLPSWVPNWTLQIHEQPLGDQFSNAELDFMSNWSFYVRTGDEEVLSSGNMDSILPSASTDPNLLSFLQEYHCDKNLRFNITSNENSATLPAGISVRGHCLGRVSSLLEYIYPVPDRCCSIQKEFWSKINEALSTVQQDGPGPGPYSRACGVVIPPVFRTLCDHCEMGDGSHDHYIRGELEVFLNQIHLFASGRRVFATSDSLGLGPADMREGDSVWLLDTMEVALILRKVDLHFIVVGECHLHKALARDHRSSDHLAGDRCSRCGLRMPVSPIFTDEIEIW
ncbi:hypothetical protein DM02DRAFT_613548 [Periconia macrospinosa]|uniref:Heterokaryon incompatibility domain-containing protein n=1 Tax=Periconia macrospinosa TaxID=97972 RepID=A0A2V1DTY8_9PLEO|nr:hypothetical protein DM02DRAFT_613548 [Periconia macrospinosa]